MNNPESYTALDRWKTRVKIDSGGNYTVSKSLFVSKSTKINGDSKEGLKELNQLPAKKGDCNCPETSW